MAAFLYGGCVSRVCFRKVWLLRVLLDWVFSNGWFGVYPSLLSFVLSRSLSLLILVLLLRYLASVSWG